MGTGQQLLTLAALMLLGIFILNVHQSNMLRSSMVYENEAVIAATGVGQSIIDEITVKAFDEKTISEAVTNTDSLTGTYLLGPETGETTNLLFDDIDDYDGYTAVDSLDRLGNFNLKVEIFYVKNMQPEVKSSVPTFNKRIDVFVTNESLEDTLKLNQVVAY